MARLRAPLSLLRGGSGGAGRAGGKRRVLVLLGAGASVEYNAPTTDQLTDAIEREVMNDPWVKATGGDAAFTIIKSRLKAYLHDPGIVNFEHIYHCAHELIFAFPPTPGAVDEFRPLLFPFLDNTSGIRQDALQALVKKMAEVIFAEVSAACDRNPLSLRPLADFAASLRADHVTRIYTTNYDDFLLQAIPDLYTGFEATPSTAPKRFESDQFWHKEDLASVFHLHGSVHMGFAAPHVINGYVGELFWFDDRATALKHASFSGGTRASLRMDGSSYVPSAVVTGLDKLSLLQQRPLSDFYSALARGAMLADLLIVIGSGLADLHLNSWLAEARSRTPKPPLLFVDYWPNGFEHDTYFEVERKTIELFHRLQMHISERMRGTRLGVGWTLADDRTSAIWDRGFQAFLNAPAEMRDVLTELRY
jgi:hypothetical protein